MPTVHIEGPYRFFWYSADRNEPAHVHVERDRIVAIIQANREQWLERWRHEFGA